eukprot:31089-Chlamydomonas_euryale.AAC.7
MAGQVRLPTCLCVHVRAILQAKAMSRLPFAWETLGKSVHLCPYSGQTPKRARSGEKCARRIALLTLNMMDGNKAR